MRKKLILGVAAATLFISGCADMNLSDTQRRSAMGAGVGALGGAVLSSATGGKAGTGAVLGAGVGALGTYIWSQNMEKQKREMEQATQGTGIGVTQTQDNQLKLDIPSDISFDTGRSDITRTFAPVLDRFAQGLRDNQNTDLRIALYASMADTSASAHLAVDCRKICCYRRSNRIRPCGQAHGKTGAGRHLARARIVHRHLGTMLACDFHHDGQAQA